MPLEHTAHLLLLRAYAAAAHCPFPTITASLLPLAAYFNTVHRLLSQTIAVDG